MPPEDEGPRRKIEIRIGLQALIERNDVQDIEVLTLVLMDPFGLNVEHGLGIDLRGRVCAEPVGVGGEPPGVPVTIPSLFSAMLCHGRAT